MRTGILVGCLIHFSHRTFVFMCQAEISYENKPKKKRRVSEYLRLIKTWTYQMNEIMKNSKAIDTLAMYFRTMWY